MISTGVIFFIKGSMSIYIGIVRISYDTLYLKFYEYINNSIFLYMPQPGNENPTFPCSVPTLQILMLNNHTQIV